MTALEDAHRLIVQYLDWQGENLKASGGEDNRIVIGTPFIRADGHSVEIEVCLLQDGSVRLYDAGETLDELWMQGIQLTDSTLEYINRIANCFRVGLSADDNVLANDGEGAARQLQDLVSAILAISALIELPREDSPTKLKKPNGLGNPAL